MTALIMAAAGGAFLASRKSARDTTDDAPGSAARRGFRGNDLVGKSVTIGRPRQELFDYWIDFENLCSFMENVISVRKAGDQGGAVWTIMAPGGRTVDVKTEMVAERPGELIGWRSTPDSEIRTEGRVTFEDAPGERGTRVSLTMTYDPPGGDLGKAVAKLFLREPEIQARHDLKRFKMLMETGEVTTSARRKSETRAAKHQQHQQTEPA
ncbi:SRPBCC family protein [Novosphingobium sp. PC22D]|uniref:SRPBCC family protein n=1 Tax=Novosphingobium sp. PC22D TaxID=1962403 RepID=UPI001F0B1D41|nr:SRPBCC family protein [Novosphingobium sp. PC22D]